MPLQPGKFDRALYLGYVDLTKTEARQAKAKASDQPCLQPRFGLNTWRRNNEPLCVNFCAYRRHQGLSFLKSDTQTSARVSNSKNAESGSLEKRKPREGSLGFHRKELLNLNSVKNLEDYSVWVPPSEQVGFASTVVVA